MRRAANTGSAPRTMNPKRLQCFGLFNELKSATTAL